MIGSLRVLRRYELLARATDLHVVVVVEMAIREELRTAAIKLAVKGGVRL